MNGLSGLGLDYPLPVYPCLLFPSYVFCWPGVGDGNFDFLFFFFCYFAFGKMRACVLMLKHFGILGLVCLVCLLFGETFALSNNPLLFSFPLPVASASRLYIYTRDGQASWLPCMPPFHRDNFCLTARPFFPKALAHPLSLNSQHPHTEHYISFVPRNLLHMFTLSYAFTYSNRPDSSWSAG